MERKEPLVGVVRETVSMRRFSPKADEYVIGQNGFNGIVRYAMDGGARGDYQALANWGCGLMAMNNGLGLLGVETGIEQMERLGRLNGANEEEGTGEGEMLAVAKGFELPVEEVVLADDPGVLVPYIRAGCVFVMSSWENSWDEIGADRRGDGHWMVVVGADSRGGVLVADSSLREMPKGRTFGVWQLTAAGLAKVAQDCAGGVLNAAETEVRPGADWGYKYGLMLGPKGERKDFVARLIHRYGGVEWEEE